MATIVMIGAAIRIILSSRAVRDVDVMRDSARPPQIIYGRAANQEQHRQARPLDHGVACGLRKLRDRANADDPRLGVEGVNSQAVSEAKRRSGPNLTGRKRRRKSDFDHEPDELAADDDKKNGFKPGKPRCGGGGSNHDKREHAEESHLQTENEWRRALAVAPSETKSLFAGPGAPVSNAMNSGAGTVASSAIVDGPPSAQRSGQSKRRA